ncbi:MAG TPA: Do family serine endopeptidase [Longimicrobiaceae bacterium]|nr:Do family serine endopeptidase [Longimicrobiaceae bacterium]
MLDPVRAKARVIGLVAASFLGGVLLASGMEWTTGIHAATLLQDLPSRQSVEPVAQLSQSFVAIADAVTPAVVSIQTRSTQQLPGGHPPIPEPFRQFFDIPEGQGQPRAVPTEAMGSGFIISPDGYIMTNNHVVEGADEVTVVLNNRREYPAKIIGRDPTTDVAVIKIDAENLPTVKIGDPEADRVGEWVLAIGNPLGLNFTVTAGIISAKGRPLPIIRQTLQEQGEINSALAIEDFIQTDAAINPGNSGGPMVNTRGEVIGINSAIASESGYYQGYGFAIPIDLAKRIGDDLIRYGHVRRPMLGVSIRDVTPEDVDYYNLPAVSGVLVQPFGPAESPARAAGVKPGDVIVAVDGEPVNQVNELQKKIIEQRPGQTVTLEVIRNGKHLKIPVQLMEAPAPSPQKAAQPEPAPTSEGKLGIRVAPLSQALAQRYGFKQPGGVVVTGVVRFGPASSKVFEGAKIVSANGQAISTIDQFQKAVGSVAAGGIVSLTLEDPNGAGYIANIRVPR